MEFPFTGRTARCGWGNGRSDLAEWEYQSRRKSAANKEQRRPPEKQSVLKHLHEIQERNKQKPPQRQRKKSLTEIADRKTPHSGSYSLAVSYILPFLYRIVSIMVINHPIDENFATQINLSF